MLLKYWSLMLAALVSRTCRRAIGALATSVTQAEAGAPAGSTRLAVPIGLIQGVERDEVEAGALQVDFGRHVALSADHRVDRAVACIEADDGGGAALGCEAAETVGTRRGNRLLQSKAPSTVACARKALRAVWMSVLTAAVRLARAGRVTSRPAVAERGRPERQVRGCPPLRPKMAACSRAADLLPPC